MKKIQSILLVFCIVFGVVFLTACNTDKPSADGNSPIATEAPKDEFAEVKEVAEEFIVAKIESNYKILFEHYAMDMDSLMKSMFSGGDTEEIFDFYGVTSLDELYKQMNDDSVASLANDYGEDYKITAKATECAELDEKTTKTFIENCKIQVDSNAKDYEVKSEELLDTTKIERVTKVTVECEISGSKKTDADETVIYCVFIDSKWKIVDDVEM